MNNQKIDWSSNIRWYAEERPNGDKYWYNAEGQLHREDGPAVEWIEGTKKWYKDGKLHREDGPALEQVGGLKHWWYNGKYIDCKTQEEFERLIKLELFW